MEMNEQTNKITIKINWQIIIISFISFLFIIIISILLHYYNNKYSFIPDLFASGFLAILICQFIELWLIKKIHKNTTPCEYIDMSCKYQNHLNKTGIELVYDKRKGTEKEGYYFDLYNEFFSLSNEHNSPDKPIKMIGVSLDTFFKNTENINDLPSVISKLCSSAYLKVMLCTLDNSELKTRLKFVNKKCKKNIKLNNTPIINQIKESKACIEKLRGKNNEHLEFKQYRFSPYATIIIINEHIYYTPNVLDYLSYLPIEEQNRNEYGNFYNAELSLRIKKDSEYGKRLVDLFDSLWQNANFQSLDKKSTAENKINGNIYPIRCA